MRFLRVLIIPTANSGVSYYRLWAWAEAAHRNRAMHVECLWFKYAATETAAWEVDIIDPEFRPRIMGEINAKVRMADVVIMGMVHTPAALNLFLSIKEAYPNIPVVAEIDDNMLSTADYNPASNFYGPGSQFRDVAVQQFKAADAMIVSTAYLKEVYGDLNENVHVVENSLDFKIWDRLQVKHKPGQIRIGWAGGASHSEDLRIVEPVIKNILAKYRNVRFVFIHGAPSFLKGIPGVEIVHRFSRIDKYPGFLASRGFDIGIAPLVDNAFNRGKSNLRWLEYAGMRVPCVASNVGHFKETLRPGHDALLADGPEDFQLSLEVLIGNRDIRRRMGNNAYERAKNDFNTDKNVFAYRDILRTIVDGGQVNPIVQPEYAQKLPEQRISSPEVAS